MSKPAVFTLGFDSSALNTVHESIQGKCHYSPKGSHPKQLMGF